MRPLTPIVMLAVMLDASACTRHALPQAVHETRTFPARAGKLVRLDVRSLDVQVDVKEADTIAVTTDLQVQSSSRAAGQRWTERHTPVFEDSDAVLEVRLPERERHGVFIVGFINTRARLDLVVPPSCRLEIKSSSGDVTIAGSQTLSGPVRVATSSGDVHVAGGVRELIADTSSGDVRVTGPALGSFEAETSSGDVVLTAGAGKAVVDTSSGEIRLDKLTGSLSAEAASGEVGASWEQLPAGSEVRAQTASGDVRLRLPAGVALRGGVSTASGHLVSQIPATEEEHGRRLSFKGTNDTVEVEIRTTSGDVTIHTRS